MPKPTTASFLSGPHTNEWCKDGDIECYLKKSLRPGDLLIPNIKNARGAREMNVFKNAGHKKTGKFRIYMDELERLARLHGYTRIIVEGIMNEFLPEVLVRRGYEFSSTDGCTTNYSLNLEESHDRRSSRRDCKVGHITRRKEWRTPSPELLAARDNGDRGARA